MPWRRDTYVHAELLTEQPLLIQLRHTRDVSPTVLADFFFTSRRLQLQNERERWSVCTQYRVQGSKKCWDTRQLVTVFNKSNKVGVQVFCDWITITLTTWHIVKLWLRVSSSSTNIEPGRMSGHGGGKNLIDVCEDRLDIEFHNLCYYPLGKKGESLCLVLIFRNVITTEVNSCWLSGMLLRQKLTRADYQECYYDRS